VAACFDRGPRRPDGPPGTGLRTEQHPRFQAGGARPDAGAHRPIPRLAPGADPHGGHLPAGGRPGGPVGPGQQEPVARGAQRRPRPAELGPQREGPRGLSRRPGHDEREARVDPEGG